MLFLVILQVIFITFGCLAIDLPSDFPKCSIDDPKVGNCIISVANKLRPRFEEGIDEIGIPSYDPLILKRFGLVQQSDMMNFSAVFRNYSIRGLNNYDLTEIRYDPTTMTFKGKFQIDPVSIHSVYNFSGKLLFIPVEGSGTLNQDLGEINGTFEITGNMLKRKSLEYYSPENIKINLTIDDMVVKLDGLFDGNEELGDMTNELINRNSKVILNAGTSGIEALAEQFVMRYFKWLTRKYPLYKLFLHFR